MLLNAPPALEIEYTVPAATVTFPAPGEKVGSVGALQPSDAAVWFGKRPPAALQPVPQVTDPTADNFPVYFCGVPGSPRTLISPAPAPGVKLIIPREAMSA